MNDPFPEELLSAYLDGELPGEERARVEAWLAASADHRRLFDDLQAIRRELQALPHQTLDAGFSDRVLSAIRQRTGDSSGDNPASGGSGSPVVTSESGQTTPVKPASLQGPQLGMPAWRWFAAGVAAALAAVLVGINAAPETMARMGSLAQLRPQVAADAEATRSRVENRAPNENDVLATKPGESRVAEEEHAPEPRSFAAGDVMDEAPEDVIAQAKEQREDMPAAGARARLEEGPVLPAPCPAAEGAPADKATGQVDKKSTAGSRETSKRDSATLELAESFGAEESFDAAERVVELPVTSDQVDRALMYSLSVAPPIARRFADTAANAEGEQDRGSSLEGSALRMALARQYDVAQQKVHIAALEVSGTEEQVHSLLDSLDVAEARFLRPATTTMDNFDAAVALRDNSAKTEGEGKPQAASTGGPSATAPVAKQEANGPLPKAEAARSGSAGRKGSPAKKPGDQAEGVRRELKQDQATPLYGTIAPQRQMRVRLVIVPQADPIEVKPAE